MWRWTEKKMLCLCLVRRLWLGLGVFPCLSGGVACVTWPLEGVVCVSLCCSVRFSCLLWGCFGLACFLLAASPPSSCPPPRLVPWGFLVQSVFCWSLSPGIWLYLATARLSCLVVWSVVTSQFPVFTFPHGNKGFGPVGLCPLHHVAGVVQVLFFPALRYSPSGDPEPPSGHC